MPKSGDGEVESESHRQKALHPAAQQNTSEPDQGYYVSRRSTHRPLGSSSIPPKNIQFGDMKYPASQTTNQQEPFSSSSNMSNDSEAKYPEHRRTEIKDAQFDIPALQRMSLDSSVSETLEVGTNKLELAQDEESSRLSLREYSDMGFDELAPGSKSTQDQKITPSIMRHPNSATHHPGQGSGLASSFSSVVKNFLGSASSAAVSKSTSIRDSDQKYRERAASLMSKLREKERELEKISKKYTDLKESYHERGQKIQLLVDHREKMEHANRHLLRDQEHKQLEFQAVIDSLMSERDLAQESYEGLIRKQQEESFKKMSTGRWRPMADREVVEELSRIKDDMRDWARNMSVTSMDVLKNLELSEYTKLLESLSSVVVLENGNLPEGLSTSKSPALLLNAFLAHHLYLAVFRDAFFFLQGAQGSTSNGLVGGGDLFRDMYRKALEVNEKDAHFWRSQTLRLLHPALESNFTGGERGNSRAAEQAIASMSDGHASSFLYGPARHLLDPRTEKRV